jgi:hypothetical protein
MTALVDSNVLLDVSSRDPHWYEWSARCMITPKPAQNRYFEANH